MLCRVFFRSIIWWYQWFLESILSCSSLYETISDMSLLMRVSIVLCILSIMNFSASLNLKRQFLMQIFSSSLSMGSLKSVLTQAEKHLKIVLIWSTFCVKDNFFRMVWVKAFRYWFIIPSFFVLVCEKFI